MPQDLSPLWISLKTALLATFITFFFGISAAYWMLGYRGKGKSLIEGDICCTVDFTTYGSRVFTAAIFW